MPLGDLMPGNYPTSPLDPSQMDTRDQYLRETSGDADKIKITTPFGIFSGNLGMPGPFRKLKGPIGPAPERFQHQKGGLGEYEDATIASMLGSAPNLFPPQSRERSRPEKISDVALGLIHGAGVGTADVLGLPRTVGNLANKVSYATTGKDVIPPNYLNYLPSPEQLKALPEKYSRFLPLPTESAQALIKGPQTPEGEYASSIGEFSPIGGMGMMKGLRKLVPYVMGTQWALP